LKNSNSIFTVKDYGTGIEPSILNHLFDIDKNNTTPGTNYEHGTGLGLILCKEFIEKHGGTIHAESIYKEGSEFTFSLPQHSI
jgi:signal transduction histidine kinase